MVEGLIRVIYQLLSEFYALPEPFSDIWDFQKAKGYTAKKSHSNDRMFARCKAEVSEIMCHRF